MYQLNSTKGTLQVPHDWLPPDDPNFMAADDDTDECIVDGEAKLVTRKTGTVDEARNLANWVEYWLDIGEQVPVLIHRSAHVITKPNPAGTSGVGRF
jgi:hypothetical protein